MPTLEHPLRTEALRNARLLAGKSQRQMAEHLSITQQGYSAYERGETSPSLRILLKICRILRITPDELLPPIHTGTRDA